MTKELNAFYNMFIEIYQKLDRSLNIGDQNELVEADSKMREMLNQMENTPSLQSIFPHILSFIHEKNVWTKFLIFSDVNKQQR